MAGEKYCPSSVILPKNVILDFTITNLHCRFLKGHQKNQTMDHLVKCNRRGIVLIRNPYKAIYGHMHLGKKPSRNDVNLSILNIPDPLLCSTYSNFLISIVTFGLAPPSPKSDCHFRLSAVNGKHSLQCMVKCFRCRWSCWSC